MASGLVLHWLNTGLPEAEAEANGGGGLRQPLASAEFFPVSYLFSL